MEFIVITPLGEVERRQVGSVVVPALDGKLGVLEHHAPMMVALGEGDVELDGNKVLSLSGGFMRVGGNEVEILAEKTKLLI